MSLMTVVIWGCLLIVVQIVAQTLVLVRDVGLMGAFHSRDDHMTPASVLGGRLTRALRNVLETFPVFVALVVVANAAGKQGDATLLLGAQIWLWARVAYVPVYAAGIPIARTLIWTASVIGLCLMLSRLV
ncbi:MAPEG family protein [Candidatus Raskinella chloraquaticus]|jgi:uncharacterized MAPEG superfamily protein|uniref:MAPEG family protein n=1 Tax=Candidatus Raskinella chloraquaticus TaxID=1951219 RepID=A0A1W9I0Z8_9HYPH|nr:MAG: hypothetical protein A4S15_05120 [Proteobacteria bacterium SG_bin8]